MSDNSRLDYIDISKGLGMLAVVWGHIMLAGWSNALVYGFDIPLFFFLSGMMFRKEKYNTLKSFLKRRFSTLIKPYLIISFVTWCIWAAYNFVLHNPVDSYIKPLLETFVAQGSGGYLVHNVPLWFVSCLLFVEICYFFVCKNKTVINIAICLLFAVIGWAMVQPNNFFDFTQLPWNIEAGFSVIIFYALGNIFSQNIEHQAFVDFVNKRSLFSIITVVLFTVLLFIGANYNGHVSLGSNRLGKNVFLFYAVAMCGTISTITFSILLAVLKEKKYLHKVVSFVQWIGCNSFYFMAIHVPVKGFVTVLVAKYFKLGSYRLVQVNMWYSLISFVISIAATAFVVYFINRSIARYKSRKNVIQGAQ